MCQWKKFWQSVNIWQRYGKTLWFTFLGHPVYSAYFYWNMYSTHNTLTLSGFLLGGELPESSLAAASRDGRLPELLGVCCWLASWCSECGVDRRKWHHAWTRPEHWREVWCRHSTAGSQVQAVAAASVDCQMKSLSCLSATACSIPRWSSLNIFYIGKLISPSFDPGLLSLDVWTSCVQAWCLFHVLCSLPSALIVSLKHSKLHNAVSLVKMSKREFIYNVTASVSSELKDKHIHIYTTHISKKTSYHQPIKSLVTIYIYWQENLATVNSRPKLGRITLLTVCEIFLCRAWNLQFSPSVFNNNNMIFIRRTDKPL